MYNIVKILQTGLIIQNITLIANDSKLFGFDGYGLIRENRFKTRAVKRAGPFNRKKFRVRALVFPASLNPDFFGPDQISPRPNWVSPLLIGWPDFFF